MSKSLGIPVKLLHEAEGHIVTVELKSGDVYRGSLIECEDNWNCQLESITYTSKVMVREFASEGYNRTLTCCVARVLPGLDGKTSDLEHVFIRGSKVRFMIIPDMLKNAPMFKRLDAKIKDVNYGETVKSQNAIKAASRCIDGSSVLCGRVILEGKGSGVGIGRGRAGAMRAKARSAGRGAAPTALGAKAPVPMRR